VATFLYRLGRLAFRRRLLVTALWVAVLAARDRAQLVVMAYQSGLVQPAPPAGDG
jgi:hypothetical protein